LSGWSIDYCQSIVDVYLPRRTEVALTAIDLWERVPRVDSAQVVLSSRPIRNSFQTRSDRVNMGRTTVLDTGQARCLRDTTDIFTLIGMPDRALISWATFTSPGSAR
jgi:hypothetical protein